MEYYVYTDGSCRIESHVAGSAFIILTKKRYIKCECESFVSRFAFEAEINAVIMALRYANHKLNLSNNDSMIIYVDSVKTINLCNAIKNNDKSVDSHVPLYEDLKWQVEELLNACPNVVFEKVHAHQKTFNTNKVVDCLAKVAIQHCKVRV